MPRLRATVGQILLNAALPPDLRDYSRTLDKKGTAALLQEVAEKHPEHYPEVSKRLADIGHRVSTESGGYSFGPEHMRKAKSAQRISKAIEERMAKILNDDRLTDEQRHQLIIRTVGSYQQQQMNEVFEESKGEKNPLAMQVVSGMRGSKMNLNSLRGSDLLYADHRDNVIPLPVLHSYSQGLTPSEYWASTYGARKGVIAVKMATQDAGYLGKQLNQIAHRLLVTDLDDPRTSQQLRGLPVDVDDPDSEGALLAHDVGPYKAHTVLSPKILKDMKSRGHTRILVRSPVVGGSPEGGVYAYDVGVREKGTLPGRGEAVGLSAAQSLSEPLSQAQLAAKHTGGVAGQDKAVGGFAAINQQIQTPAIFKGGAAHATTDGRVERIEEAPAGGLYVSINGERHYVNQSFPLKVKKGDEVEAGDMISEGLPNHSLIVAHKGIGEGRRYFVNSMRDAYQTAGIKANRRNLELLARGLINHVRMTEETDHHIPNDVVPYSSLEHTYVPRDESVRAAPGKRLLGQYLEEPVLHYSIGTKIRPSVLKDLDHFGVKEVTTHSDPPPFEPEMIRGAAVLHHDPDFMTRMYGAGLKSSLLDAVHRKGVSNEEGTSFVPGLARAVDFGRIGLVRPPEPGTPPEKIKSQRSLAGLFKIGAGPLQPPLPKAPKQPALPGKPPAPPSTPPIGQPPQGAVPQPEPYDPKTDYVAGTASGNTQQQWQSHGYGNWAPWGSEHLQPRSYQAFGPGYQGYGMPPTVGYRPPPQRGYSPQGGYVPPQPGEGGQENPQAAQQQQAPPPQSPTWRQAIGAGMAPQSAEDAAINLKNRSLTWAGSLLIPSALGMPGNIRGGIGKMFNPFNLGTNVLESSIAELSGDRSQEYKQLASEAGPSGNYNFHGLQMKIDPNADASGALSAGNRRLAQRNFYDALDFGDVHDFQSGVGQGWKAYKQFTNPIGTVKATNQNVADLSGVDLMGGIGQLAQGEGLGGFTGNKPWTGGAAGDTVRALDQINDQQEQLWRMQHRSREEEANMKLQYTGGAWVRDAAGNVKRTELGKKRLRDQLLDQTAALQKATIALNEATNPRVRAQRMANYDRQAAAHAKVKREAQKEGLLP